ncbi:MAG: hypothetical protein WC043_09290 [Pseudobdellovibrionaceae bacterium]
MSSKDTNWLPCPSPEVGDTLRWNEPIFAPPNRPRGKPDKKGEQRVTAILRATGEVYVLDVIEAQRISGGGEVRVKAGDQIRRKPTSLTLGACAKATTN